MENLNTCADRPANDNVGLARATALAARRRFAAVVHAWRTLENSPTTDDSVITAAGQAYERLIEEPAPDFHSLEQKLRIAVEVTFGGSADATLNAILRDMRRLASEAAPQHHAVEPHNAHLQHPWSRAIGAYQAAAELALEAKGTGEEDVATADSANAFKQLIDTRVPDLDALREKVRIIRNELGEVPQRAMTQLLADIDRLN